jgi:hypothetical protein
MNRRNMYITEAILVKEFKTFYADILLKQILSCPNRRFVLLEEFNCYNGIADIVLAVFRPYIRLQRTRASINNNWIHQLAQLSENKVISLDEYVALFGVSCRTARKQLENFVNASFVECLKNDTYRVNKPYTPILDTTVSIEAKLHDWKRALGQAYRYKRFSNYSFVLLPTENADSAIQNMDLFIRYNVGLITLGKEGLTVHYCPCRRNSKPNDAYLRVNESAYQQITSAA